MRQRAKTELKGHVGRSDAKATEYLSENAARPLLTLTTHAEMSDTFTGRRCGRGAKPGLKKKQPGVNHVVKC